jgi:elongation factor Ts
MIAKLGENMLVRRVTRFELEGGGMLDSYVHGGRVAVLVDVAGGSPDNPQFVELAHDLALHVAAAAPRYLAESDIPAETIEAERDIYRAQIAEDNKPENIKERIIDGKVKKWYSEVILLNQPFVKDSDLTIGQLLQKYGKALNSNIRVRQFARFELGAG